MDNRDSLSLSVPTGFLLGVLGGVALSMGLVGMVVGMSLGGGAALFGNTGQIAQNPPVAPTVPDAPAPPSAPAPVVDPNSDHIRGNKNAKITVIEYSDFECPFCKRHHPTMTQLLAKYGDDVNWVYRHYPLGFHPAAQKSAEASECVAEIGGEDAFWKYADTIMAMDPLTLDKLAPAATAQGIDEAKFNECLNSGKYASKVTEQMNGGSAAGVSGTPGNIIVNNDTDEQQQLAGAYPLESFTAIIDGMLGK